jgi:hypothetical protein
MGARLRGQAHAAQQGPEAGVPAQRVERGIDPEEDQGAEVLARATASA